MQWRLPHDMDGTALGSVQQRAQQGAGSVCATANGPAPRPSELRIYLQFLARFIGKMMKHWILGISGISYFQAKPG